MNTWCRALNSPKSPGTQNPRHGMAAGGQSKAAACVWSPGGLFGHRQSGPQSRPQKSELLQIYCVLQQFQYAWMCQSRPQKSELLQISCVLQSFQYVWMWPSRPVKSEMSKISCVLHPFQCLDVSESPAEESIVANLLRFAAISTCVDVSGSLPSMSQGKPRACE